MDLENNIEIERKYLIEMPDMVNILKKYEHKVQEIEQIYLETEDSNNEIRIRKINEDSNNVYWLTHKKPIDDGLKRFETEEQISKLEYLNLATLRDKNYNVIRKNRYKLLFENHWIEIDIYDFWADKAILEIELQSEYDDIQLPKDFVIIEEVTLDKRYKNKSLAKTGGI